jgi:iron complex transport system permease protein
VTALAFSYPWWRLLAGFTVLVVIGVIAVGLGAVWVPPLDVFELLIARLPLVDVTSDSPAAWDTILWKLRLPRIVLAAIVGSALAVAGATYQGLFRNPLADPSLIGATSGAGLGATVILVTGVPTYFLGFSMLPIAAFTGALGAVAAAYLVARRAEGLPLTTLILAGVAVGSLATAVTSLLMIRSDPDLRPVLSWLLGGFISSQWKHSLLMLPYLIPSVLLVLSYGRILNVFQLDDEQARQLGVNVERAKILLISAATLATAAAVSFSGLIGFVGLVAPHVVRLVWGPDYRFLVPMAAIIGAGFLILADLVARTVVSPAELPVGVVTAFCGAPFLLYLLRRRKPVSM